MDRLSSIPLYLQLKNDIIEKIEKGVWSVNDQIPSEKELMRLNDVGRETVRKAVSILVQEGYLIKKRGIGTFITNKKPTIGFEPLISLSHSLQVRGLKEKNRVLINEEVSIDDELESLTKMEKDLTCRYLKRLRYIEGKPLAVEDAYLKMSDETEKYNFENSISNYLLEVQNIKISKLEQVITPRWPSDEEKDMLNLDDRTKVLELDRWLYVENEEHVYFYIRFIIPADIYNLAF